MRVVLPLFGTRVAPRCLSARRAILVEIERREIVSRRTLEAGIRDEADLIEHLLELRADRLVCGEIRREFRRDLARNGIEVVHDVAGEVDEIIEALRTGRLSPGYGLHASARPPSGTRADGDGLVPRTHPATIDCLVCADRPCLRGDARLGRFMARPPPLLDARQTRFLTVAHDVSSESDPRRCRVAELIHFVLGMSVHRIGLAYCWELFHEAEVLVPVLSRHFTVVPVCCRVGAPGDTLERPGGPRETPACRPDLQAALLKEADTEINVMAGLCIGCDLLFAERSHVPVTTLFVRDRVLAHNPIAAIHTRYYLDQIESRDRPDGALADDRRT